MKGIRRRVSLDTIAVSEIILASRRVFSSCTTGGRETRYANLTMPLQNCVLLPTSTSYLRMNEFAIVANAEHRKAGAQHLDAPAFAHRQRLDAGRNHHASARIHREGAQLDAVPLDVLNQGRLAGVRVDREHSDAVLASRENFFALKIDRRRGPVRLIDEPAVRMNMDSACARAERRFWVRKRFLDEHRLAGKPTRGVSFIDIEFVLALERHINPRLNRNKVQMARTKMHPVSRLYGRKICQHSALEAVGLDRTRIHWVVIRRIVAARNHNHKLIVRGGTDLMRVFPGIALVWLVYPVAKSAIPVDVVYGKGTWVVVGRHEILPFHIDAGVDRTRRQVLRLTVRRERGCIRIDSVRMREVFIAGDTRPAAAGDDVEILPRWMRPRVLDIGR